MKISAVILVKDEVDLLPRSLAALLRAGVTSVSIMDDNSSDGTRTAIDALCAALPDVYRIATVTDLNAGLKLDGPVFGPVLSRDQPDWLLVGDPDEFWIPQCGDLRRVQALDTHDVVVVERFNAALRPGEPDLARLEADSGLRDLPLLVEQVQLSRERMEAEPRHRWVTHKLGPKLMVRPGPLARFDLGMHAVFGKEGSQLRQTMARDIVIAHIPFSTFERFDRKVQNARHVFERFDREHSGDRAWHWRRWVAIRERGGLRAEYDRQFLSDRELAEQRQSGAALTATEIFAARDLEGGNSCRPLFAAGEAGI